MTDREKSVMAYTASACLIVATTVFLSCQSSSNPKVAKAETDFCRLRALYVLTTAGQLDAPVGSARAELEKAEDDFCTRLVAEK